MTRTRKKLVILAVALVVSLVAEASREFIVFYQRSKELQHAYWKVKPGMSKAEVFSAVGQPDATSIQSGEEFGYWRAADCRGPLIRPVTSATGQYTLVVNFDDQGKVLDVYSGSD
jgi:outer membrane protein assembly factor BamE (lipoprotein component of BamABCDE complex)